MFTNFIIMKVITFLVFILILKMNSLSAQSETDFLMSYNKHIDPLGSLDSIKVLTLKVTTKIKYSTNSTLNEINNIRLCNFYADGARNCFNSDGSRAQHLEIYPIPEEYSGNAIKYQLEFIPIDETPQFSFQLVNDSITVIKKEMGSRGQHVFTFDSNTKHLLQRSTISEDGSYISYTNYLSYQVVNGILVPKKVTFLNNFTAFSNHSSTATIENENVEFKYN